MFSLRKVETVCAPTGQLRFISLDTKPADCCLYRDETRHVTQSELLLWLDENTSTFSNKNNCTFQTAEATH
ncbi:hypothetical protein CCH79_00014499 [Gambusia affinis]|uniref:Uncharacterized protein n=1 Tax=Gambusia affinis TaxID=33528 RepID=A0A315V7B4_GAMAF|nr:hypothetical protein CCH79_00014499 [Gambusia affinis]